MQRKATFILSALLWGGCLSASSSTPTTQPATSAPKEATSPKSAVPATKPPLQEPALLLSFLDTHQKPEFSWSGNRLIHIKDRAILEVWDADKKQKILSVDIRELNTEPSKEDNLCSHSPFIKVAQFSQDGAKLLTSGDDRTRLWDVATGKQLLSLSHLSPSNGVFYMGDIHSRGCNRNEPTTAQLSPDGTKILTASRWKSTPNSTGKKGLILWDATDGRELLAFAEDLEFSDIKFNSGGTLILALDKQKKKIYETSTGKELFSFVADSASFSPDGSKLLITNGSKIIKIVDARSGNELLSLNDKDCKSSQASFDSSGTKILTLNTCDSKYAVRLWDTISGEALLTLKDELPIASAQMSPDGSKIATGSGKEIVKIWDATTGKELFMMKIDGDYRGAVYTVEFSPDGTKLSAMNGDNKGAVWKLP